MYLELTCTGPELQREPESNGYPSVAITPCSFSINLKSYILLSCYLDYYIYLKMIRTCWRLISAPQLAQVVAASSESEHLNSETFGDPLLCPSLLLAG